MDQAEVGEARESLANHTARDTEAPLQLLLGGECVSWHEDVLVDLLVQDVSDLHVQGPSIAAVDSSVELLN